MATKTKVAKTEARRRRVAKKNERLEERQADYLTNADFANLLVTLARYPFASTNELAAFRQEPGLFSSSKLREYLRVGLKWQWLYYCDRYTSLASQPHQTAGGWAITNEAAPTGLSPLASNGGPDIFLAKPAPILPQPNRESLEQLSAAPDLVGASTTTTNPTATVNADFSRSAGRHATRKHKEDSTRRTRHFFLTPLGAEMLGRIILLKSEVIGRDQTTTPDRQGSKESQTKTITNSINNIRLPDSFLADFVKYYGFQRENLTSYMRRLEQLTLARGFLVALTNALEQNSSPVAPGQAVEKGKGQGQAADEPTGLQAGCFKLWWQDAPTLAWRTPGSRTQPPFAIKPVEKPKRAVREDGTPGEQTAAAALSYPDNNSCFQVLLDHFAQQNKVEGKAAFDAIALVEAGCKSGSAEQEQRDSANRCQAVSSLLPFDIFSQQAEGKAQISIALKEGIKAFLVVADTGQQDSGWILTFIQNWLAHLARHELAVWPWPLLVAPPATTSIETKIDQLAEVSRLFFDIPVSAASTNPNKTAAVSTDRLLLKPSQSQRGTLTGSSSAAASWGQQLAKAARLNEPFLSVSNRFSSNQESLLFSQATWSGATSQTNPLSYPTLVVLASGCNSSRTLLWEQAAAQAALKTNANPPKLVFLNEAQLETFTPSELLRALGLEGQSLSLSVVKEEEASALSQTANPVYSPGNSYSTSLPKNLNSAQTKCRAAGPKCARWYGGDSSSWHLAELSPQQLLNNTIHPTSSNKQALANNLAKDQAQLPEAVGVRSASLDSSVATPPHPKLEPPLLDEDEDQLGKKTTGYRSPTKPKAVQLQAFEKLVPIFGEINSVFVYLLGKPRLRKLLLTLHCYGPLSIPGLCRLTSIEINRLNADLKELELLGLTAAYLLLDAVAVRGSKATQRGAEEKGAREKPGTRTARQASTKNNNNNNNCLKRSELWSAPIVHLGQASTSRSYSSSETACYPADDTTPITTKKYHNRYHKLGFMATGSIPSALPTIEKIELEAGLPESFSASTNSPAQSPTQPTTPATILCSSGTKPSNPDGTESRPEAAGANQYLFPYEAEKIRLQRRHFYLSEAGLLTLLWLYGFSFTLDTKFRYEAVRLAGLYQRLAARSVELRFTKSARCRPRPPDLAGKEKEKEKAEQPAYKGGSQTPDRVGHSANSKQDPGFTWPTYLVEHEDGCRTFFLSLPSRHYFNPFSTQPFHYQERNNNNKNNENERPQQLAFNFSQAFSVPGAGTTAETEPLLTQTRALSLETWQPEPFCHRRYLEPEELWFAGWQGMLYNKSLAFLDLTLKQTRQRRGDMSGGTLTYGQLKPDGYGELALSGPPPSQLAQSAAKNFDVDTAAAAAAVFTSINVERTGRRMSFYLEYERCKTQSYAHYFGKLASYLRWIWSNWLLTSLVNGSAAATPNKRHLLLVTPSAKDEQWLTQIFSVASIGITASLWYNAPYQTLPSADIAETSQSYLAKDEGGGAAELCKVGPGMALPLPPSSADRPHLLVIKDYLFTNLLKWLEGTNQFNSRRERQSKEGGGGRLSAVEWLTRLKEAFEMYHYPGQKIVKSMDDWSNLEERVANWQSAREQKKKQEVVTIPPSQSDLDHITRASPNLALAIYSTNESLLTANGGPTSKVWKSVWTPWSDITNTESNDGLSRDASATQANRVFLQELF